MRPADSASSGYRMLLLLALFTSYLFLIYILGAPQCLGVQTSKFKSFVFNGHGKLQKKHLVPAQLLCCLLFFSCAIYYLLFRYYRPEELSVAVDPVDRCAGRYIFVHDIPSRFNRDLVREPECHSLIYGYDMCVHLANDGLGPPLNVSDGVFGDTGWYGTDQYILEVIFHARMKEYKCLTSNSSMASAIYVPAYVGLEFGGHTWGYNTSVRDAMPLELVRWLREKPEWEAMDGRDHFMATGRSTWDLRRPPESDGYGSQFLFIPEIQNMTVLIFESSPWHYNDFAIPYPTSFHPSRDSEVFAWQDRMRKMERPWLFCFAGGTRAPDTSVGTLRDRLMGLCSNSTRCNLLTIGPAQSKERYTASSVMRLFQSSVFCLQPPGDSATRRSTFDSILAGCIPVFLTPASAYTQYAWHLPRNYTKYSVLIPEDDIMEGKVTIDDVLEKFSEEQQREMREEVIETIPKVVYRNPKSADYRMKDGFDLAVEGVMGRVGEMRRLAEQGLPLPVYNERMSWKRALGLPPGRHDWDRFFHL